MSPRQKKQNIKLLYHQAEKLRDQGVFFQAIEIYKKLLPLYQDYNDSLEYGRSLLQIGLCYRMANENKKALNALDVAQKYYHKINNLERVAYTYREIGNVYLNMDKYGYALKWYEKSADILHKTNDLDSYGMSLARIGLTKMHLKQYQEAEQLLHKGLKLVRSQNHWFFEISVLYFIGKFYFYVKKYYESIKYLEEAEVILNNHKQTDIHTRRYGQIWGLLAYDHLRLNNFEVAKKYYLDALKHLFSMPHPVAVLIYKTIRASEFIKEIGKKLCR